MKKLLPIIIVAILINLVVTILYNHSNEVPSDEVPYWDNIVSGVWILGMVAAIIISIIKRKELFKNPLIITCTIICLIFCSPFPWVSIIKILNPLPDIILIESTYNYTPGKVHKTEHWEYSSGQQKYIDKCFVADSVQFDKATKADLSDSIQLDKAEQAVFKKDSIWVYFNKDGGVIKTERYDSGKLIPNKN